MTSVVELTKYWDALGRPTPALVRDRPRAMRRAKTLLARAERENDYVFRVQSDFDKECLYAVVSLARSRATRWSELATKLLALAEWHDDSFEELEELRVGLSTNRKQEDLSRLEASSDALFPYPDRSRSVSTERFVEIPVEEKSFWAPEINFEDSEMLHASLKCLQTEIDGSPASVGADAESLFWSLKRLEPALEHADDRTDLLGEFAMLVGIAARVLFRRKDAREWFARAETNFALGGRASLNLGRLAYQRLALATEERRFEEVLRESPVLERELRELGLTEEALKCRFLEANALGETGQVHQAIGVCERICVMAEATENTRLLSLAFGNLAQFHRVAGDLASSLSYAQKALPYLQQETRYRVALAKLRWTVADIFREQGNRVDALKSYRSALTQMEEIGIRLDVVDLRLVIAELLLDEGSEREAEEEVRAALPIIDEEEMVPESMAALGLLRESLRRRQLDRGALRELHGYFPKH